MNKDEIHRQKTVCDPTCIWELLYGIRNIDMTMVRGAMLADNTV